MSERLQISRETGWAWIHAFCVFMLSLYFLFWDINFYLCESLYATYYLMFMPPLVAFCLYFRWGKDCVELRALLAFWIWFNISRVLNGGQTMVGDFSWSLNFSLYYAFAVVGFVLEPKQRMTYLTWLGAILSAYISVLAVFCIIAAVYRTGFANPITKGTLCWIGSSGFSRLLLYGLNPNISAIRFFAGMSLAPFLFFRCKRKLWRIPVVLSALLCYTGLALTYSRNTMMAFSGCIAMLLVLLLINSGRIQSRRRLAAVSVCLILITIPVVYKSFELPLDLLSRVSAAALEETGPDGLTIPEAFQFPPETPDPNATPSPSPTPLPAEGAEVPASGTGAAESAAVSPEPSPSPTPDAPVFQDARDFSEEVGNLSGRTRIFFSGLYTMLVEPFRFLRGCDDTDIMRVSHEMLPKKYLHMHNSFLQVLNFMGLPGLVVVLLFSVLLIRRAILVFFSKDPRLSMAVKTLTLPLAGIFAYNMLEVQLFYYTDDFFTLFFFLIAGMLLAWSYDVFPAKKD